VHVRNGSPREVITRVILLAATWKHSGMAVKIYRWMPAQQVDRILHSFLICNSRKWSEER